MRKCTINFGDIVLAPIPWADKEIGFKVRPAVVISRETLHTVGQIIVLGISSKEISRENEYKITSWEESGLKFPSKIWLSRPYAVSAQGIKKIGELKPIELLVIYRRFLSFV